MSKMQPCLHNLISKCTYGEKCNKLHFKCSVEVPEKTCLYYLVGTCKHQDKCNKGHDIKLKDAFTADYQKALQQKMGGL